MLIEFARSWRRRIPGDRWDAPDGVGNLLIRRGIAVGVFMPQREPECAMLADGEQAIHRPPKARKRGRPRKEVMR